MNQYLMMEADVCLASNGAIRKVLDFRKRGRYSASNILIASLFESEELRVDRLAERLLGSTLSIDEIVDVNDTDLLSAVAMDTIYYYKA